MSTHYVRPRSRFFQSRVTNGGELLPGIDGRSRWARRLHDLIANHVDDMGGPDNVSQAQYLLIKSAANLIILMEKWEVQFAQEDGASLPGLMAYQTSSNSLRRIYESLGMTRTPQRQALDAGTPVDMSKLTPTEQQRLTTLVDHANTLGLHSMPLSHVTELRDLMVKGRATQQRMIDHAQR